MAHSVAHSVTSTTEKQKQGSSVLEPEETRKRIESPLDESLSTGIYRGDGGRVSA